MKKRNPRIKIKKRIRIRTISDVPPWGDPARKVGKAVSTAGNADSQYPITKITKHHIPDT